MSGEPVVASERGAGPNGLLLRGRRGSGPASTVGLAVLLALSAVGGAGAQQAGDGSADGPVRVFLDCPQWLCDFDYARRQIPFVTWVRDRQVSDVHLLVTEEETGGGGDRFTLDFIGRRRFEGRERRLTFSSDPTQTEAEEREGLVRTMQIGLVGYAAETSAARGLRISYDGEAAGDGGAAAQVSDPWNRWVFDVDVGGDFDSEERETSVSFDGGLSVNRTTPEWKIDIGVGGDFSRRRFDVGDGEEFVSIQRRVGLRSVVVNSLGAHWSVGGQASIRHATRRNQDLAVGVGPALEFNVFPYEESSRRQLTILYSVSAERFEYADTTVFGALSEGRTSHALDVSLDAQQPWGELNFSVEGAHFLRELQQNRLTVSGRVEIQLVEGLSFDVEGSASRIRDQIYLPAAEASEEEILVGEREFATEFEKSFEIGLSYTFGSIYSDVVNPRFESMAGGGF